MTPCEGGLPEPGGCCASEPWRLLTIDWAPKLLVLSIVCFSASFGDSLAHFR